MVNTKNSLNKIVFLDRSTLNSQIDLSELEKLGECFFYEMTSAFEVQERMTQADVVITNKVELTGDVLRQCPQLKLICIAATGTNNVDLKAAEQLGISVQNVVGYSTASVVQHTFTLLFSLCSHLFNYNNFVKTGKWSESSLFTCQQWPITEIRNKNWGIIGLGTIGEEVAKVARSFGANIQYYSTSGKHDHKDFKRVELNELLSSSEIISIHAPLNEKTKNLLSKDNLAQIKTGSILINVGRGGIINEKDLYDLAKEHNIYVGLDVIENEPMLKDSYAYKLSQLENIIITPHIAWASLASQNTLVKSIVSHITKHFS